MTEKLPFDSDCCYANVLTVLVVLARQVRVVFGQDPLAVKLTAGSFDADREGEGEGEE